MALIYFYYISGNSWSKWSEEIKKRIEEKKNKRKEKRGNANLQGQIWKVT